ncbi:hypothetical protein QYF36_021685 [Acer negundo]|nr:hypothetical protein QYF36_021685 [Acer negundo]
MIDVNDMPSLEATVTSIATLESDEKKEDDKQQEQQVLMLLHSTNNHATKRCFLLWLADLRWIVYAEILVFHFYIENLGRYCYYLLYAGIMVIVLLQNYDEAIRSSCSSTLCPASKRAAATAYFGMTTKSSRDQTPSFL